MVDGGKKTRNLCKAGTGSFRSGIFRIQNLERNITPEFSIISAENTCSLSRQLADRLAEEEAVKRVYGRSFAYDVPASWEGTQGSVCLFSYEENQLQWAQDDLLVPSKKAGESVKAARFTKASHFTKASQVMDAVRQGEGVLVVFGYEGQFDLSEGDVLSLQLPGKQREVTVLSILSDTPYTTEGETQVICSEELFAELEKPYVSGVTLSGGDPLHLENRRDAGELIGEIRRRFPGKTIWLYTGYDWEEVKDLPFIGEVDVLVDGKFVEELKDNNLHWKGSSNQRVIDVKASLRAGEVVLHSC